MNPEEVKESRYKVVKVTCPEGKENNLNKETQMCACVCVCLHVQTTITPTSTKELKNS